MIRLIGAAQHYAWGSDSAIPAALGIEPDGRPWAELWWGTHPGGRTMAATPSDAPVPLAELAGRLPYLVKLLAAARPLSL
ncbi:MAG: mannose-6-phosphate isomerase, class I, partial [Actinobacteria bacterium]|nr:mannose-6-phosphate isomerase, class I [Actinomycetota bacterium]